MPQPAPPPAHSSHSSQTFLAVRIGIGPGRVPQVKDATWAWAGFLVKAGAFPQAHPLLLTNPQAVREKFLQHRVSGSQVNSQSVCPEQCFHLSSGEPPSPLALGPASLFYALRPHPSLGTRSGPPLAGVTGMNQASEGEGWKCGLGRRRSAGNVNWMTYLVNSQLLNSPERIRNLHI